MKGYLLRQGKAKNETVPAGKIEENSSQSLIRSSDAVGIFSAKANEKLIESTKTMPCSIKQDIGASFLYLELKSNQIN
jgi:hypothetical protein